MLVNYLDEKNGDESPESLNHKFVEATTGKSQGPGPIHLFMQIVLYSLLTMYLLCR